MSSVAIIDYGMGNLHSIAKALQHVAPAAAIRVTADKRQILQAEHIVFPGVGAIGDCMEALRRLELAAVLKEVSAHKPLLGICLGLQALLEESEEGGRTPCLGVLPGRVVRFEAHLLDAQGQVLKIPHMGWNRVHQSHPHPLWRDIPQDSRFYFVHSYYAKPARPEIVAATSDYPAPFTCALAHENIFAVQFHPEKSQAVGLRLLKNFLDWDGVFHAR